VIPNLPVIVVGAGGHAGVVADALVLAGFQVLGFTDPDTTRHGARRVGLPVLGGDDVLSAYKVDQVRLANGLGFVRGPGLTSLRARVQQGLEARGWTFVEVRHPEARVSRHAILGAGTQVLSGAIVQAGASVGVGTIVNTAAIVEHDTTVGRWCHLATRATLCGEVSVSDGCLVGAGAVVRQGIRLAEDITVGAGAVVVRNGSAREILCGVPARPLEKKQ
jgi:sugar O-acyltransferase (sialic acid O-acetyltransferase NeuD family)